MKKWLLGILVVLTFSLCSCGAPDVPEKTTLMVYMIGSDLEAQAGAGTRDLMEMAASGVDLERVNVVVYAGGSPHWHNESADPQEHNLLWLTEEGFEKITSIPTSSMGEAACLSNFLTYAHANFPADEYALVLWDHGDGPVIGYGKDMLFDKDSLTLQEMGQAMENSPFAEEKLAWVGFDACLMASAELACVWGDYAHYLVASQETEPSFGWNYDFLASVGQVSTPELLPQLTQGYLASCLEYYESRGYEDRDTTLSCVDLSYATKLNSAINDLFAQAAPAVEDQYNTLSAKRVQTRALGRASTGSEYDLIDLQDMTAQLEDLYPKETAAIQKILGDMVISNATNAENCCGLSLYYPFYNKYYFEESWGKTYENLGLFPEYDTYLKNYQNIWLENDKLEVAASEKPQCTTVNTYTLQLSDAQQENFASARYYILVRDGEEYFTRIYSSHDVTNKNGLLTANFDGNVLYVKDNFGDYQIPVAIEHDTVAGQTRYSVYAVLMNYSMDLLDLPEGFETQLSAHRFGLSIDNRTKEVTVNSLVPCDHSAGTETLAGGKLEETELSDWENCLFVHDDHRYLTRYENGAIMPVEQWEKSTLFSGVEYPVENGIEFVCAPLVKGEYYLLFEVEDTQGNRYCSELLPIQTEGKLEEAAKADPIDISWEQGERVLLTEASGVQVYLEKQDKGILSYNEKYVLSAVNSNDYSVYIHGSDVFWNDVCCDDFFSGFTVPAGQTVTCDTGTDLGIFSQLGLWDSPGQLSFDLSVQKSISGAFMLHEQPFRVTLSRETMLKRDAQTYDYSFRQPHLNARAQEQVLLDSPDYTVTLLGLGGDGENHPFDPLRGVVCVENRSSENLILDVLGGSVNGIYIDAYTESYFDAVPPESKSYQYFELDDYALSPWEVTSVEEVTLLLRRSDYSPLFSGNSLSQLCWCPLQLSESGTANTLPEGERVLFEENGIRVSLLRCDRNYENLCRWYLSIANDTGQDIGLGLTGLEEALNADLYLRDAVLGAHQKTVCTLSCSVSEGETMPNEISFRLWIMDFKKESILYTGQQEILLQIPPYEIERNEEK